MDFNINTATNAELTEERERLMREFDSLKEVLNKCITSMNDISINYNKITETLTKRGVKVDGESKQ